jgi:hypothetical protein
MDPRHTFDKRLTRRACTLAIWAMKSPESGPPEANSAPFQNEELDALACLFLGHPPHAVGDHYGAITSDNENVPNHPQTREPPSIAATLPTPKKSPLISIPPWAPRRVASAERPRRASTPRRRATRRGRVRQRGRRTTGAWRRVGELQRHRLAHPSA